MGLYWDKNRVESARLKGWDYAAEGWYFVTICTRGRECFFGKVVDQRVTLSKIGDIALRYWEDIPNHSANASLDAFVIMPNHLHGIVMINAPGTNNRARRDVGTTRGLGRLTVPPGPGSLGAIVRSYKSAVTRWYRMNGYASFAWQPRFYDHVIRDEAALQNIRRYILDNPAKWELDRNNLEKRVP